MAAYQKLKKKKKKKNGKNGLEANSGKVLRVNQPKRLGFIMHHGKIEEQEVSTKKKKKKSGKEKKKLAWQSDLGECCRRVNN